MRHRRLEDLSDLAVKIAARLAPEPNFPQLDEIAADEFGEDEDGIFPQGSLTKIWRAIMELRRCFGKKCILISTDQQRIGIHLEDWKAYKKLVKAEFDRREKISAIFLKNHIDDGRDNVKIVSEVDHDETETEQ